MPTVVEEGQFRFVINTRENEFEPPHVHVWVGNDDKCRLELNGGCFMDKPPLGDYSSILKAYRKHVIKIRQEWDRIRRR